MSMANRITRQTHTDDVWQGFRINEICIEDRRIIGQNESTTSSLRYLSLEDIESETGRILANSTDCVNQGKSATFAFDERHVLYGKLRPYLNKVALPDFPGRCTTELIPLLPNSELVRRKYLAFLLRRKETVLSAMRGKTGSRMPRADMGQLLKTTVKIPPLSIQDHIIANLEEQFAEVERARKAVEAQLQAAEVLPGAFLGHVFSSSALQQWPGVPLSECCDLLPSKSICLNGDVEVQAITSACLTEWGFSEKGMKVSRMWAKDVTLSVAQAGEIHISRSNTPELVGRVSLFPGTSHPVVASDLTIRIMPRPTVSGEFIAAFLSNLFVTGFWKHRAGGASGTMKKITRRQIENLILRLPALPEQNKHVMTLNAELQGARLLRASIEQKLSDIKKLPAALLREAFTGAT